MITGFEYMIFILGAGVCIIWGICAFIVSLFRNRDGG